VSGRGSRLMGGTRSCWMLFEYCNKGVLAVSWGQTLDAYGSSVVTAKCRACWMQRQHCANVHPGCVGGL
jgi:hypothetical protein